MTDKDSQLLCTFSKLSSFVGEIESIEKFYSIVGRRIYVLQNLDCFDDILLTYNVSATEGKYYPQTISIHRKRDHNVLYSINALNELVKMENSGEFSPTLIIDWSKYRNTLITTKDGKLKITPTKLVRVFYL
jgi:uncharacterized protein (DUF1015 family)